MAAEKGRASNGGSSENLAAASPLNDRGRSMSPVQTVSTTAAQSRSASGAMTHRGALPHAWAGDGPVASPRTPRHPAGSELRLGIVVAELQRQTAEDRRLVQRQLEHMERRLQEQLVVPAASRERWADLQGSVSGLLEEVSSLVRRVEGLDEKFRIRTSSCEELLRQRTRELEQQVSSQQQKVQLAVSTFEEMSKRQTAKLRKVAQTSEEQARKLMTMEEAVRRHQDPPMRLEARLSELEGQQASLEEEFRNVAASTTSQRLEVLSPSRRMAASVRGEDSSYDVVRAVETELATLSKHLAAQLDEHSSALANLRVRTDGQEKRLAVAGERLEKVVAPTLEALRAEMQQLRMADRSEADQRFEHLSRQLQGLADSSEEAISEVRDLLDGDRAEGSAERLRETCAAQDQQLRRLEALVLDSQSQPGQRDEELCGLMIRVEGLEHRLELVDEEAISEKADRAELHRLDLSLQEFSEPLRRLSQRTATNEARTSSLEHKFEQFQEEWNQKSSAVLSTLPEPNGLATKASLEAMSQQLGQVVARIVEMEAVAQRSPLPTTSESEAQGSRMDGLESSLRTVQLRTEKLEKHVTEQLQTASVSAPESAGEMAAAMDELSERVSKAVKIAESSGSNLQSVRFDLVVEQERVAKLTQDLQKMTGRVEKTESSSEDLRQRLQDLPKVLASSEGPPDSDLQPKINALAERVEDAETRTSEALQKMLCSIDKVQVLHTGLEGSNRDLTVLVEGLAARVEGCETQQKDQKDLDGLVLAKVQEALSDRPGEESSLKDLEGQLLAKAKNAAVSSVEEKLSQIGLLGEEPTQVLKDATRVNEEMLKSLKQELEAQLAEKVTKAQLSGRSEDLTRKVEASEATICASMQTLEAKLSEILRKLNASEDDIHELRNMVEDALQRVEATEAASRAVREELMSEDAHGEACPLARTCQNDLQGVHSDVADLQASLRTLARRVEQTVKCSTSGEGGATEADAHPLIAEAEPRILELQQKVVEELEALTQQQEELGKAKVTMADLSDRVRQAVAAADECKKATAGLEQRLQRLSSIEETTCPKCGNIYLADAKFCRGCGHRRGEVVGTKAAAERDGPKAPARAEGSGSYSDVEDSYAADDSVESVDDASISEDRAAGVK